MMKNSLNHNNTSNGHTNGIAHCNSSVTATKTLPSNGKAFDDLEGSGKKNGLENAFINGQRSSSSSEKIARNGNTLEHNYRMKERLKQKEDDQYHSNIYDENEDSNDNNDDNNDVNNDVRRNEINTNGCAGKANVHENFSSRDDDLILEKSKGSNLHKRRGKDDEKAIQSESFGCSGQAEYSSGGRIRLVKYESLPSFLHDNEFLVEGHRPVLNSVSECFRSVGHLHSETWNIWTHLLGALMTLALMIYHMSYLSMGDSLAFLCFFSGAIFCQAVSSLYHTLICHSEPVCKLFAKLDYCGVITLITTSEIAWLHFAFYCQPWLKAGYISTAAIAFVLSLNLALRDKFREPAYRWIRFGLFAGLALSNVLPTIHYFLLNDPNLPASQAPIEWVFLLASFYAAGGFIYATRVPERFYPGKFDIHCQSHQILHVCVIAGVMSCYIGLYRYSCQRLATPCLTSTH